MNRFLMNRFLRRRSKQTGNTVVWDEHQPHIQQRLCPPPAKTQTRHRPFWLISVALHCALCGLDDSYSSCLPFYLFHPHVGRSLSTVCHVRGSNSWMSRDSWYMINSPRCYFIGNALCTPFRTSCSEPQHKAFNVWVTRDCFHASHIATATQGLAYTPPVAVGWVRVPCKHTEFYLFLCHLRFF